jgi:molybdopterin converting factor small subunit
VSVSGQPSSSESSQITISVQYTGIYRVSIGERSTRLTIPRGTNFRGVVRRLAELYPDLVGLVITTDDRETLNATIISRNEEVILPEMMDQCPEDGDQLILIPTIEGG